MNAHSQVDPNDEAALAMFFSQEAPERRTLADIIMEKIREKEMMDAMVSLERLC